MKKVLHVLNRMGYGGIEAFIMNIYRNIDHSLLQFDFALHSEKPGEYDDEIKNMGGNIIIFPQRRKQLIRYYKAWDIFLKEDGKKYEAIHMHVSSLTTIIPIVLAKKYNIKTRIVHAHSTSQKGILHTILSYINKIRISKYATKLLACSSEAGNYVFGKNHYGLFNNGIKLKDYMFNTEKRKKWRKNLNLKDDEIALVHVGRFTYAKNHTFLIDIFNEIKLKKDNYKLFLVGTGELEAEIKLKVERLGLNDNIIFLGTRNDVSDILQAMDIFVFPSNFEGLPVAMVEAQASGLPIFASSNISPEVKISDLVEFISLDKGAKYWASKILKIKVVQRINMTQVILDNNYDIDDICKNIEKIY